MVRSNAHHSADAEVSDFPVPLQDTLDGCLGLITDLLTAELARGHVDITDRTRQRWGIVHGGVYAALAELLASEATSGAVRSDQCTVRGLANQTSFLRPVSSGTVHGEARRRHRGRTTWVWEVDFTDSAGRLCALSLVTVAVRAQ